MPSIFQSKQFRFIFIIFLIPTFLIIGFFVGQKYQLKVQEQTVEKLKLNFESEIKSAVNNAVSDRGQSFRSEMDSLAATIEDLTLSKSLKEELQAMIQAQGQIISKSTGLFESEDFPFTSPLLENKEVNITNYRYRRKNIVHKEIEIDEYSWVEYWEYTSPYDPLMGPTFFSTIGGGYEGYFLSARPMEEIVGNWKESYKIPDGIEMYYDYDYAPKDIWAVNIGAYYDFFPKNEQNPFLVRIWTRTSDWETDENHPAISKTKVELNKLVDTFVFDSTLGIK